MAVLSLNDGSDFSSRALPVLSKAKFGEAAWKQRGRSGEVERVSHPLSKFRSRCAFRIGYSTNNFKSAIRNASYCHWERMLVLSAACSDKCSVQCKNSLDRNRPVCRMSLHDRYEQRWGRSSVWLERLPVTQKAASSSLVAPAIIRTPERASCSF